MPFNDLASAFQAGKGAAVQSPFETGAGNVFDLFKEQQETAMKLAQTAALFKGEKGWENQNDPTKLEAQAKLNASGLGGGTDSGGPPPPGTPFPGSQPAGGALGTNVPTSFTSITGQKFDNQNAQVTGDVIKKQLDASSQDAAGAALMMQKMDELKKLHDQALNSSGIDRAKVSPSPFGLATRASQATQAAELSMQGPDNPSWQNYENAKSNFSQMADRGLFGEKGKLTGQQIKSGQLLFPGKSGTLEGDQGLWDILYSIPKNTIDFHNNLVQKNLGVGSPAGIQTNPIQNAAAAQQNNINPKTMTPERKSEYGTALAKYPGKKSAILAKYKEEAGADYE